MTRTIAVPLPENFTGEAYWMNRYKPWEEPEITCVTVTGYTAKRVVIDDLMEVVS